MPIFHSADIVNLKVERSIATTIAIIDLRFVNQP